MSEASNESNNNISMEVARSLYAQMCHFHDETEEQKQVAAKRTHQTANLVKSIGTLLLVFVIAIGFFISQLTDQFINIIDSMDKMNNKVTQISTHMAGMTKDIAQMDSNVRHMEDVLVHVKKMNHDVSSMSKEMASITGNIVEFNEFGIRAMNTMKSMNAKMGRINQSTGSMNRSMHDIARPAKMFPK